MGKVTGLLKMLSAEEMDALHENAVRILEKTGMMIESDEARRYFESAGCKVDESDKRVRFPRRVVEDAVELMRKRYEDDSDGQIWANVRYSRIYFTTKPHRLHTDFTANTGGFPPFILDFDGKRRKGTYGMP